MTYGFIGTGNMGGALARALVREVSPSDVYLNNRTPAKAETLAAELGARADTAAHIAAACDYIFLGVKPNLIAGVLAQLAPTLAQRTDKPVLVSMAAGVTIAALEQAAPGCPILRIMPNTACAVGAGLTLYDANALLTKPQLDAFLADPYNDSFELPDDVIEELNRTSHRHYSPGFYFGKEQAQQTPSHTYVRDWDFIGTVDSWENGVAHCTQRGKFAVGDSIEILQPDGSVVKLTPAWIENADGERVDATPHPMMQYTIPCETPLMAYSLIRMQKQ